MMAPDEGEESEMERGGFWLAGCHWFREEKKSKQRGLAAVAFVRG